MTLVTSDLDKVALVTSDLATDRCAMAVPQDKGWAWVVAFGEYWELFISYIQHSRRLSIGYYSNVTNMYDLDTIIYKA